MDIFNFGFNFYLALGTMWAAFWTVRGAASGARLVYLRAHGNSGATHRGGRVSR
jgi:hypothetical protein